MKAEKRTRKQYDEAFKRDDVALVTEQGYKLSDAGRRLGINPNLISRWKQELEPDPTGQRLTADERAELTRLRRENKQLQMETEILKKSDGLLRETVEVRYAFMTKWANDYPVRLMCRILQVNKSAYYEWKQHGAEVINAETFALCSRMKALFIQSRESLGSRGFVKHLRKEGYDIGRYRVRRLMKQLQLVVKTKRKYRVTTQSKHAFPVAENVLNRKFNPEKPQSSLGKRHHVCMDGARLVVLGRGDGFIFAAHCWLVYGPNHDTSPGDSGTDDGD